MIKDFPEFGQLELSDKNEIFELTKDFLSYSDFSFSNMWSWDIALSKRGFSKLNGNLTLRLCLRHSLLPINLFSQYVG